jgi:hypothetical protein
MNLLVDPSNDLRTDRDKRTRFSCGRYACIGFLAIRLVGSRLFKFYIL